MNRTLLILILIACSAFADDPPPSVWTTREYRVSTRFVAWLEQNDSSPKDPNRGREWLTQSGVVFAPTTSIVYVPSSQKLIVRHSRGYHRAIAELIAQWKETGQKGSAPDPKIIQKLREFDAATKQ